MNPLDLLIEDGIIDLELTRLKSGKEADVFLVDRGAEVLVAKVYKNRAHRSFKNNADYKEGRKVRNSRTRRAIKSGSKFGREAEEDEWKNTEAATLNRLYATGVRVPKPVMFYEGVLLMHLVRGADGCPADRLIDAPYDAILAKAHYLDLRGQMIRMLCIDLIHGDLSPYNILDAAEGPTIIDFPQIISAAHTNRAADFFLRDFDNVLEFLCKANPSLRAHTGDGRKIWQAYSRRRLTPDFVPAASRPSPPKSNRGRKPGTPGSQRSGGRGKESSRPQRSAKPGPQRSAKPGPPRSAKPGPPRGASKPAERGGEKPESATQPSGQPARSRRRRRRNRKP